MMTGDKVDKATMTYGNRDDMWVANKVRMLMRDDLDHEFVCVGGRDRIMYLSQEVDRLRAVNAALTAENTRIFAMVDAREQTIAELTALCDEYRGERDALEAQNDLYRKSLRAFGAAVWDENEAEWAEKVTRARAEGMDAAVKVVESVRFWNLASRKEVTDAIRAEACRLAEQANKGEDQ